MSEKLKYGDLIHCDSKNYILIVDTDEHESKVLYIVSERSGRCTFQPSFPLKVRNDNFTKWIEEEGWSYVGNIAKLLKEIKDA